VRIPDIGFLFFSACLELAVADVRFPADRRIESSSNGRGEA